MKIQTLAWSTALRPFRSEAKTAGAKNSGAVSDDPQSRRLQAMREGLERLRAMPSPEESRKQAAKGKVGLLKQRLDLLKRMLLYASPEQARALARELKSIAKELASIGLASGPSTGTGGVPAMTVSAADPVAAPVADAEPPDAQAAETSAPPAGEAGAAREAAREAGAPDGGGKDTDRAGKPASDDGGLRELLKQARKLLRETIGLVKSKLAAGDKEARQNVQAAERSLSELDRILAQGSGNNLYTAQGELNVDAAADGLSASPAASGAHIDLTA